MNSFLQYLSQNLNLLDAICTKFQQKEDKSPNKDEFESVSHENSLVTYYSYPFKHMVIENVLPEDLLLEIESDYARIPLHLKSNDLFHFKQSLDLKAYNKWPVMEKTHKLIIDPLKQMLAKISGIKFSETNDLFFSKYDYADYLLCHDDLTENRAFAFIYYMTPPEWTDSDGGHLELYDRNIMGYAKNIVKKYVPKRNTIALFKVSPKSFHAIEEIFTLFHERKAITGWFHYEEPIEMKIPTTPPSFNNYQLYTPINNDAEPREIMMQMINEDYLKDEFAFRLRESMGNEYQVMLSKFLKPNVYQQVLHEMQLSVNDPSNKNWKKRDFPQICCINVMHNELDPIKYPTIDKLKKMFKSIVFSYFISTISGIDMFSNSKEDSLSSPANKSHAQTFKVDDIDDISIIGNIDVETLFEIQHFNHGCYTLANDLSNMVEIDHNFLDVFFIVMEESKVWHDDCGGTFNYEPNALNEEDTTPREITPTSNSLVLSIKHFDENNYVKYINYRTNDGYAADEYFLFYSRFNIEERTVGYRSDDIEDDYLLEEMMDESDDEDENSELGQHIPDIGADYVDSSSDDDFKGDIVESDDSD